MVDSGGRVAAHTGSRCIPFAGHVLGEQFSCQGNIMRSEKVWTSMQEAFVENRELPFAERLVRALEAGEAAGGDIRGKQSSALLVVSPTVTPTCWSGKLIDLRVEDHPQPVPELKRLLRYQRAYDWVARGDDRLASDEPREALAAFRMAAELAPEVEELRYWVGLSMLATGEKEAGLELLRDIFAKNPSWVQVTRGVLQTKFPRIDPKLAESLLS